MPRTRTKPSRPGDRHLWALRMTDETREQIRKRSKAAGLSMSDYMIKAALGELEAQPADVLTRFADVEQRLERLEQLADLG